MAEVTAANHGLRGRWDNPPGNVTPANVEVTWSQPDQPEQTRRIRPIGNQAVVGPVIDEGALSVSVRFINEQDILGPQTDALTINDYRPAGWFDRSMAPFYTSGNAAGPDSALLVGMGFTQMAVESGDILVPGKLPSTFGTVGFDLQRKGPFAGLGIAAGFGGEALITFDHGVTWQPTLLSLNSSNQSVQDAKVLPNGRILIAGTDSLLQYSDDQGETWEEIDISSEADSWGGFATITTDNEDTTLVIAGTSTQRAEQRTIIAISQDHGENWVLRQLQPSNDDNPPGFIFAVHMLGPNDGFAGGDGGLFVTEDGWESSRRILLPQEPDDQAATITRMVFDESQENGFIAAQDGLNWSTTDGGRTWVFVDDLARTLPGEIITSVIPLSAPDSPFQTLLGSNKGTLHRLERQLDPPADDFTVLKEPGEQHFTGIVSWQDMTALRAVTQEGVIMRGVNTPETLVPFRSLNVGQDQFSDAQVNAMAASADGNFIVLVGNHRYAQYSVDQGDTWFDFVSQLSRSEHLIDVALDANGNFGLAIGGVNQNTVYQISTANPRLDPIDPLTIDPDQNFQGDRLTAMAMHPTGQAVAVLAAQDSSTRLFIGTGDGGNWAWRPVLLPLRTPSIQSMAVSRDGNTVWLCGRQGSLFKVVGSSVQSVNYPTPPGYNSVEEIDFKLLHFDADLEHGYLINALGWTFTTTDGGQQWVVDKPLTVVFDNDGIQFNAITATADLSRAIIVGDDGRALWTANGGVPQPRLNLP